MVGVTLVGDLTDNLKAAVNRCSQLNSVIMLTKLQVCEIDLVLPQGQDQEHHNRKQRRTNTGVQEFDRVGDDIDNFDGATSSRFETFKKFGYYLIGR